MNFSILNYFLVVAEELNITKAAERLYISQQSLSSQIIKLEKELGVQLFNRTPYFTLTYAGNRLVKAASEMMTVRRQVLNEIDDITGNRRGEIKLGISHTRGRVILPDILPLYHETHPLVEISLLEANSRDLEQSLQHGIIDLMISFAPFMLDSVETINLCREKLVLVVHKKFLEKLYGKNTEEMRQQHMKGLMISEFKECPFLMLKKGDRLRSIADDYYSKSNIQPNIILEAENIETVFRLALKGLGVLMYPEMYIKKSAMAEANSADTDYDFFPIDDDVSSGMLAVGYSHNHYLSSAARDFIDLTVDYFKKQYNT